MPAPSQQDIRAAISRGVKFLAATQNKDGSWGLGRAKAYNIIAPVPGGHDAFRAATTALCVMALIESRSEESGAAAAALQRGEDWLLENLPKVRLSSDDVMYDNWARAYGIEALIDMLAYRPMNGARRETICSIIVDQLRQLERHQHLDGGWGYYNRIMASVRPPSDSNSFMTATVLIAMHKAREAGLYVPGKTVERALENLRASRRPDFAYTYSFGSRRSPVWELNQPPGSLGRSQACNAACYIWGDKAVTHGVIKAWLNRLFARKGWLDTARKQQFPHEGYYSVAAYFYYYGHYYAAFCIGLLPLDERQFFRDQLAHTLLPHQEKDGSWWDFALYRYHQQYGTAFAVLSLTRCLSEQAGECP